MFSWELTFMSRLVARQVCLSTCKILSKKFPEGWLFLYLKIQDRFFLRSADSSFSKLAHSGAIKSLSSYQLVPGLTNGRC